MPDPVIVPTSQATQASAKDLFEALDFIKAELAKAKAGGVAALVADAPQAIAIATKDIADIRLAVPEIKSGMKSTEFWAPVGAILIGGAYFMVTKKDIPVDLTSAITALLGIYVAARTMLKAKQITSATPTK